MKLYKFPLQPLLRAKSAEEKQEKVKLSQLIGELDEQEKKIEAINQKIEKLEQQVVKAATEGTDASFLKKTSQLLISRHEKLRELLGVRDRMETKVNDQMDVLKEAVKERRTLENYKERLMQEYYVEEKKKEEKVMDDLLGTAISNGGSR